MSKAFHVMKCIHWEAASEYARLRNSRGPPLWATLSENGTLLVFYLDSTIGILFTKSPAVIRHRYVPLGKPLASNCAM